MKTNSCRFLEISTVALTVLAALISLGVPTAAAAQNIGQLSAILPQGPEGSRLYTVTIPGYTFQGIETYSAGAIRKPTNSLSVLFRWRAPAMEHGR